MFAILAVIGMVGVWISGMCVTVTFFGGVGVWLSTFLTQPLFQNTDVLLGEIWTFFGWSVFSWVLCFVVTIASSASTGLSISRRW